MLTKFLSSKISGYIAIGSVLAILGLVAYIYHEGKKSCTSAVVQETLNVNEKSRKDSHEVRKQEQALNDPQLDTSLCALGIVRQNSGCK